MAAFPLMGSPGPATLSLAATGAAFGRTAGHRYLVGIIIGTTSVLIMVATGITGLILALPGAEVAIPLFAAAYILYLAWKIATAPPLACVTDTETAPAFIAGFLLGIANPKAFAAIGAVYTGTTVITDSVFADAGIKLVVLTAVIVTVNSFWLYFGSLISGLLRDPTSARITNILFAILLVSSVVFSLAL